MELIAVHRQHMLADAAMEGDRTRVGTGGTERGEERQQVFVPRVGAAA